MFNLTLAIETLRVDPHAIALSYVLAARILPAVVFTLGGGVLADRVPRRLVMLAADAGRGVAVAVVTVLVATGGIDLVGLVCMALVFGLGAAGSFPAATAITPELVPADLLAGASALNGTSLQLAGVLVGPAVGGLLVGFAGTACGFGVDAGGLGGLLATVIAGGRRPPRHRLLHLWIGWGLSGVGVPGLGFVPDLWLAGGVAFVTYGLDAYGSVLFNPLIQQGVPDALLGPVSSVDYLFGFALSPLGLAAAGVITDAIGVRSTLVIGGAITALTGPIPLIPGVEDPTL